MPTDDQTARKHPTWHQSFAERAALPKTNKLTSYLLRLMVAKSTNLCVSADVQSTAELLDLAEECGESICILKTHCDIIYDFDEQTIKGLLEIAARKHFLIFEDRKFGDIGNTVQTQYAAGTHRIASWAAITNAHIFPGPAIITALKEAAASAVTLGANETSTMIFGGKGSSRRLSRMKREALFLRDETSNDSSVVNGDSEEEEEKEEEEEEEGEESDEEREEYEDPAETSETESASSQHEPIRRSHSEPGFRADRKASVVSISTTISSTTELVISHSSAAITTNDSSPQSSQATALAALGRPPLARGLLLLAQMSSKDNLFTPPYTDKCVALARTHRDFVMGFVAQEALNRAPDDNFLVMTPGVSMPLPPAATTPLLAAMPRSLPRKGDGLGQQYKTPRSVILEHGADVIIVGRGILNADDRIEAVERYRWEGWMALTERWSART